MAGYFNYSMSNGAREAYQSGEKPISKWSKSEILAEAKQSCPEEVFPLLGKVPASVLRDHLLTRSSWHHTSSHYNRTDFYSVIDCSNITLEQVTVWAQKKQQAKKPIEEFLRKAEFLEWSGTRKFPKATRCVATGIVRGNWFYLPNGLKKSITAKGFKFLD